MELTSTTSTTTTEHSIILGTLLGDGFLQKRAQKARLRISHSLKQKEYVDWKYQKLLRLCQRTSPPVTKAVRLGYTYSFSTQSERILLKYHSLFYSTNGIKTITSYLFNYVKDPLSLAIWWLDGGNACTDCNAGRLATQAFTLEEQKILQQLLFQNFNIETNIVSRRDQYFLYIPSKIFPKLVNIIKHDVEPIITMHYKLGKSP